MSLAAKEKNNRKGMRASSPPLPTNVPLNRIERGEEIVARATSPTMPRGIVGINTEAQAHRPVAYHELPLHIRKITNERERNKRIRNSRATPNSIAIPVRNAAPQKSCTVCGRRMRKTRRKRREGQ
jgi:hypothetical protein